MESPEKVRAVLSSKFGGCDDCTHQATMQAVTSQFRLRLPRWWVVNNVTVVPIWIVEFIRMHPVG
jgi:hypothetical protein